MTPRSLPTTFELARGTDIGQHPRTRAWEDDQRLPRLAVDHELDLRLATDREIAADRARLLDVGQEAEAFLNRWAPVSDDLDAMLSIRFEGLDPKRPFVDACGLSRPFTAADAGPLAAAAGRAYGGFAPSYVRVFSAEPLDVLPGTRRDKRFLAAPVGELADESRPVPAGLQLRPTNDLRHWDAAAAAYAEVDAAHPAHPRQASLQPHEDLQESVAAGTLFDVLRDGEWVGYVGATIDTRSSLGLPAYEVQELVLTAPARGQGLGPHLTTLLARSLPDPDRVLIGTVHADNRGAVAAALAAGRHDVGGWVQVPLQG